MKLLSMLFTITAISVVPMGALSAEAPPQAAASLQSKVNVSPADKTPDPKAPGPGTPDPKAPDPKAPTPDKPPAPTPTPAKPDDKTTKPEEKPKPGTPKPYKDVITADAKSEVGLFTVHRIDEKVYFEIPVPMLDREMLWSTEIAELPAGLGYGGTAAGNRVVRWTRRNNKIYLRTVDYSLRANEKGAIQRAVEAASLEPVVMAFDVEAEGKEKSVVIEVTRLFNTDVPEFSPRQLVRGGAIDPARTYIDKVKAFPTNIETKVFITYSGGPGGSSISTLIHHSLVLLPTVPMMGRLYDSRVGFFREGFEDYTRPEHRVLERYYITRYRLEKKDPTAKVSDPVKPIVYYISREVPEKWRPYLKKGVESWNEAFEAAGFKNAIVCKDAPSVEEDPNWDPEDVRYSVIRWAPTTFENAMGPHVHDPRSGEIISAHIIVWHNILKLVEDWYFTQVSPLDERARKLPLPDELIGELLQYVITHEVGHTFGLEHNFKGSSSYTIAQLRSHDFTSKYGDEASIMDYGRFNYVAQPGDNARLIPRIGPYDRFAIQWGYTPIPGVKSPDDEKTQLDLIAAGQVRDPELRFGNSHFEDPTQQTEDLGNDPVEATRLGLLNIGRVASTLIHVTNRFGEDYTLLQEMYDRLLGQRYTELQHVLALIGGVVQTDYHAGRGEQVYRPEPREKQQQALEFLVENAFNTPHDILIPEVLYRIEPAGVGSLVLDNQRVLLNELLSDSRIGRMLDAEALQPGQAYTISQMVSDLQAGLWSELSEPQPTIDPYRRNLQRAYLQLLKGKLVGDNTTQSDLRPIAIGALRQLASQIDHTIPRVKDTEISLHLVDCRKTIDRILNPRT